ncbi:DUF4330 domain-containing protein [Thermaerobacter sp. PB12/4term]|uniref:DUF4330 domain-containing protein n=1 Tax=Thermaerobacter sp. PB12/4term TaxID=2293838 RepID=UPI000E329F12|nr:DUF4330 domain-containing protein [Thermaerobacter sp. PB12/4term]QIA26642.1 DUF4330 domain-containing protein [Thermaerobacter sp. PB12/4term]
MEKRFRFNLLDLLVIVVLLAVGFVVYTRIGPESAEPAEARDVTFTVLVSRVPEVQARNMFNVGDVLYSPSAQPAAEVVDVTMRPSPVVLEDGGFLREGESRYFRDVLVTARGRAVKVQNHYELRGQSLQIGREFSLATPRTVVKGTVVDVRW